MSHLLKTSLLISDADSYGVCTLLQLPSIGVAADAMFYNVLLEECRRSGMVSEGRKLLKDMMGSGVVLGEETIRNLIATCSGR